MHNRNKYLSPEIQGKIRQFYRLLLSYGDFKQSTFIASHILQNNIHEMDDRRILEALNCAMIVSYIRPFSGNDRGSKSKIPDLPKSFLKDLDESEREIHELVLEDRNTLLAHSDSLSAELRPIVWRIKDLKILVPIQRDRRAPLTREATSQFFALSQKMAEKVMVERHRIEPELLEYFDEVAIEKYISDMSNNGIEDKG